MVSSSNPEGNCVRCDATIKGVAKPLGGGFWFPRFCVECNDIEKAEQEATTRAEAAARWEFEKQKRESEILGRLHSAGANPWEHGAATLDSFDTGEKSDTAVTAVREFTTQTKEAAQFDPVRGLYLFGNTGCGKTHLAVAALREFLVDPSFVPREIVFDNANALMAEIQDTYNTQNSTMDIIRKRIDAKVWILDDLGTERASDDAVTRLTLIFTERALRPTLVTSNNSPATLEQRHPEFKRVQSRLGPAYFRTVEIKGRDRRFDKAAA